jgi:DNA-binding CsgD family transcriptional regulator
MSDLMEICDLPSVLGLAMMLCSFFYVLVVTDIPDSIPSISEPSSLSRAFLLGGSVLSFTFALSFLRNTSAAKYAIVIAGTSATLAVFCLAVLWFIGINTGMSLPVNTHLVHIILGAGFAGQLSIWSALYATQAMRRRVAATAASAIVASFVIIVLSFLGIVVSYILITLFIVAATLILTVRTLKLMPLSDFPASTRDTVSRNRLYAVWWKDNNKLQFSAFFFGALYAVSLELQSSTSAIDLPQGLLTATCLLIIVASISYFTVRHLRTEDANAAYQPSLMIIALGLAAIPLVNEIWIILPISLAAAGVLAFFVHYWNVIGNISQRHKIEPLKNAAAGFLSPFVGMLFAFVVITVMPSIQVEMSDVLVPFSLIGLLLLICVSLFSVQAKLHANEPQGDESSSKCVVSVVSDAKEHSEDFSSAHRTLLTKAGITPREIEVLCLVLKGRSVPYICDELFIAQSTVQTHVKHIYEKFNVGNKQQLIDLFES